MTNCISQELLIYLNIAKYNESVITFCGSGYKYHIITFPLHLSQYISNVITPAKFLKGVLPGIIFVNYITRLRQIPYEDINKSKMLWSLSHILLSGTICIFSGHNYSTQRSNMKTDIDRKWCVSYFCHWVFETDWNVTSRHQQPH